MERDSSFPLAGLDHLSLLLNDANFSTAEEVSSAINHEWSSPIAAVMDSRRIEIKVPADASTSIPALLARIENLEVEVRRRAKVGVNERTGTVVMGKDVHLGAVSLRTATFRSK